MPKNISAVRDSYTNFSMWVELYNDTDREIELAGYFFSDDPALPRKWNPAAQTIAPGGFALLWFERPDRGGHANFKLKPEGGSLYLFNRSGLIVDEMHYPPQYRNVSYGRSKDGEAGWYFFAKSSPGASNSEGVAALASCPNPEFTLPAGIHDGPRYFGFKTPSWGKIYYSLDGSEPDEHSIEYEPGASVYISKTTVLRAICLAEDALPGELLTATYFIGEREFDLPIVSLVVDPIHLWDNTYGIYVDGTNGIPGNGQSLPRNYNQDWSRPANFELIDTAGLQQLNQELDIAIAGGWTRASGLKSLKIQPRKKFGDKYLNYDFFPVSKPGQLYKDIMLRNSGNDNGRTQMRDGFIQSILRNRIDLDYLAYEPAVLFINGKYYGIENLRERSNKDLIYCNYGLDEEDIIIDGVPDVDEFPLTPEYAEMHYFIEDLDMDSDTAFQAVCRLINMENYINYQVFEIYVANTDWPHNNFKLWKRKVDGKWRWIVYDLDFGFNGANGPGHNTLAYALGEGNSWGQWSTMMFRSLMKNTQFRQRFIDKTCIELSKSFEPERVIAILDSMSVKIANEIVYHKQRWGSSVAFNTDLESIRSFARQRPDYLLNQISNRYLKGASNTLIRLSANHSQAGYYLNESYIQDADIDLKYFLGQEINIRAARVPQMRFSHWEVNGATSKLSNELYTGILDAELSLRAVYEPDPQAAELSPKVLINEIVASNSRIRDEYGEADDYIELYNYGDEDVNLAGWYLSDMPRYPRLGRIAATDSSQTRLRAKSWLCLWADGQAEQGPLHLNFKLDAMGESLSLSKEDEFGRLILLDTVTYPPLDRNMSYARIPDGGSVWEIQEPSFAASNVLTKLPARSQGSEIEVYPVLVKSLVYVSRAEGKQLQVYDARSRLLMSKNCEHSPESIDLSGLPAGLYLLKVDQQVFKLIKQ